MHQTTLTRWRREGATVRIVMSKSDDDNDQAQPLLQRRPQDFPAEQKLRIIQQKRVRKLENELRRKDKALAEAAALLVLAKKRARALLADEDDETTGSDDE